MGLYFFCGFGITAGAHRLWTHRSFKASWPLRVVLAIGYTLSLQVSPVESPHFPNLGSQPTRGVTISKEIGMTTQRTTARIS